MSSAPATARPRILLLRDIPEEKRWSMERFADELTAALRERRPDFDVRGFALRERPHSGALPGYLLRYGRYPAAAARQPADLYHVVDHGYAQLAALLPKRRTIVTCHDLMPLVSEEGVTGERCRRSTVLRFRASAPILRRVARVVCDSDSTAADLARLCRVADERIRVIPMGIDPRFAPLPQGERLRLRRQLAGPRRALLHVSSAVSYKNVPGTLRVVAAVRSRGHDVALLRVGDPLTAAERALAAGLGLQDSIVELGRVGEERLVEIYNAAEALLFPSLYEGFGWPPLEAMGSGTPVVCSDRASLPEVVGDAALTAAADDIAGLAAALEAILESQELARELSARGIARAAGFSWSRTAAAYARAYDEVLARAAEVEER